MSLQSKTAPRGRFARGIRGRWFARCIGPRVGLPVPLKGEKKGRLAGALSRRISSELRRLVAVDVLVEPTGVRAHVPAEDGGLVALLVGDDRGRAALDDVRVAGVRIRQRLPRVAARDRVTPVGPGAVG